MADQERWSCTTCGVLAGEPATRLLDRTYGTQYCLDCKSKRIFHLEIDSDDRPVHLPSSERPPERGA
jgi:hypothetical protein